MRYLKEEDKQVAARFLFLSMAILVIRQDIRNIQEGTFKIKNPYLDLIRKMEYQARLERMGLIQEMKQKDLHVIYLDKNETFSSYLFMARGYEEKRRYFNPAIRKKVEDIIYEMLKRVQQSGYSDHTNKDVLVR